VEAPGKTIKLFLVPALLVLVFSVFSLVFVPKSLPSVFLDIYLGQDYANVSEIWVIPSTDGQVFRTLPVGGPFSDLKITAVNCAGNPFIYYANSYSVLCSGSFPGNVVLGVNYILNSPYACYGDSCIFLANFFENTPVSSVDMNLENADYFSFGNPEDETLGLSSFQVVAQVPSYYEGVASGSSFDFESYGRSIEFFGNREVNYTRETILLFSFELVVVFVLWALSNYAPSPRLVFEKFDYDRTPREIARLFFRKVGADSIIIATIFDMAKKGYLKIESRHIVLQRKAPKEEFEKKVHDFIKLISDDGSVFLDDEWLNLKTLRIGKKKLSEAVSGLKKSAMQVSLKGVYDEKYKMIAVGMQASVLVAQAVLGIASPVFAVHFKTSMLFGFAVNAIWIFLTLKSKAFFSLTRKGVLENAFWNYVHRISNSRALLETTPGIDYDMMLSFSALHDNLRDIVAVSEKKKKLFTNINDPRHAANFVNMMIGAAGE
jgi:hypothetical protein